MNIPWLIKTSDDEVVEKARKRVKASRKAHWLMLVYAVGIACYALWTGPKVFDLMEWQANVARGPWLSFWAGVSAGISMGTLFVGMLGAAFVFLGLFLSRFMFDRRDELLIHYYDELRSRRD